MLSLIDINKAINDKIKAALVGTDFESVKIVAEDVSKPIIRPSIKVDLEQSENGKFNASCREKTLTIRVYFFASDANKYKIENLKFQDIIETALLDGLYVNDAHVPVDDITSDVADTVLIISFDLYLLELMPEDTTNPIGEPLELMEELNYKEEIK